MGPYRYRGTVYYPIPSTVTTEQTAPLPRPSQGHHRRALSLSNLATLPEVEEGRGILPPLEDEPTLYSVDLPASLPPQPIVVQDHNAISEQPPRAGALSCIDIGMDDVDRKMLLNLMRDTVDDMAAFPHRPAVPTPTLLEFPGRPAPARRGHGRRTA